MTQFAAMLVLVLPVNGLSAAVVGAGAGVYFFYRGFRLLQRRRLILNTPTSKIRGASMGLVEISGVSKGPSVISSPLARADCFYYRSIAWELRREGKSRKWVKIAEENLHVPFYLDDGSGTLLIEPQGAELDLHCDVREEYGSSMFTRAQFSDGVTQFLTRHGADFERPIKVEEYCIKPEAFLFVLGTLAQNQRNTDSPTTAGSVPASPLAATAGAATTPSSAGLAPGHSRPLVDAKGIPLVGANYRQIVHLSSDSSAPAATEMTQQQRVAAALVKAGITNPAAWTTAGVAPENAAQPRPYIPKSAAKLKTDGSIATQPPVTFDPHPPVVLMRGTHDPTFLISWRSQRDLASSLGWKSALMIWGGPALTLVCVYILLSHFNWR